MTAYKIVRRDSEGNAVSYNYTDIRDKYHYTSIYPIVKYTKYVQHRNILVDIPSIAIPPDKHGPLYCFVDKISAADFMHIDRSYVENRKTYIKYKNNYELWTCDITPSGEICGSNTPQGTTLADSVLLIKQIPMIPAYKVLRRIGSDLVSLSMSHARLNFPVDIEVIPKIHCGPICCTNTMDDAIEIMRDSLPRNDVEIWKCLIAKSAKDIVYMDTTPTKLRGENYVLGTHISQLPPGTILADVVKIVDKIF